MTDTRFSKWVKWDDRNNLKGVKYPGVYCIGVSETDLTDKEFEWEKHIVYFGMTNSKKGLQGRLQQFENTIKGNSGHGGAARVIFKHKDYEDLKNKLYVSVSFFECDVKTDAALDLRVMGEVAKFEYVCFANFVENYGCLPEFNDKDRSPKTIKNTPKSTTKL